MANKILNTRIMLRYASHEDWISNNPILQRGEVAVATVATKQSTAGNNGPVNYVPSVLLKVGDGEHRYSELDFTFAKAADVLEACKDENTLKSFINTVIGEAGIATDEAMQALAGRVTTAEGAIDALEALVGTKKVETQISDAIAALNLDTTYETKGAAATALTEAKSYTDGKDSAMNTRVAAIEAKFGDGEGNVESQIEAAVAAEAAIARAAEQANASAIAAEKSRAEAAEQANANAIAGVVSDYTTKAQAKAYADAKDAAIKAAQDKADANEAAIATLNGNDKTVGSVDYKVAQEVAKILNDNDSSDIDTLEEIAAWIKNDTAGVGDLNKKVAANETAIATLNGNASTEGSVDKKIADAITAANLGQYALDSDVEALEDRVTANENALTIVNGNAETAGSIAKAQADAIQTAKDYADGLAVNYATAAQGTKADSAIQEVTTTENGGLKITKTGTSVNVDLDDSITFILFGGDATSAWNAPSIV